MVTKLLEKAFVEASKLPEREQGVLVDLLPDFGSLKKCFG